MRGKQVLGLLVMAVDAVAWAIDQLGRYDTIKSRVPALMDVVHTLGEPSPWLMLAIFIAGFAWVAYFWPRRTEKEKPAQPEMNDAQNQLLAILYRCMGTDDSLTLTSEGLWMRGGFIFTQENNVREQFALATRRKDVSPGEFQRSLVNLPVQYLERHVHPDRFILLPTVEGRRYVSKL